MLVELTGNSPTDVLNLGIYYKATWRVLGKAAYGEILGGGLLQSCSAECWGGLLGAGEAASCRTQDAGEAGAMGTHRNQEEKNPFLFQCTSSCLYWQGLTSCQLQQSSIERAQLYFERWSNRGRLLKNQLAQESYVKPYTSLAYILFCWVEWKCQVFISK